VATLPACCISVAPWPSASPEGPSRLGRTIASHPGAPAASGVHLTALPRISRGKAVHTECRLSLGFARGGIIHLCRSSALILDRISHLPDSPGVLSLEGMPTAGVLYVGKAKRLRSPRPELPLSDDAGVAPRIHALMRLVADRSKRSSCRAKPTRSSSSRNPHQRASPEVQHRPAGRQIVSVYQGDGGRSRSRAFFVTRRLLTMAHDTFGPLYRGGGRCVRALQRREEDFHSTLVQLRHAPPRCRSARASTTTSSGARRRALASSRRPITGR